VYSIVVFRSHANHLVGHNAVHVELMRDDAGSWWKARKLRQEFYVVLRCQIQRYDGGRPEIDGEEILLFDRHPILDTSPMDALPRIFDSERVDIATDGAAAVSFGCGDNNAAVTTAQIVQHVILSNLGKLEHGRDNVRRRRDEDDVGNRVLPRSGFVTRPCFAAIVLGRQGRRDSQEKCCKANCDLHVTSPSRLY